MTLLDDDSEWMDWLRARWALLLGALLMVAFGFHAWSARAVRHPAGILVAEDPLQENLTDGRAWNAKGHAFQALARFHVRARVLSTERYRWDRPADISPLDLALGWGRMSDTSVLDQLNLSQSDRWFHWSASKLPIPESDLISHAANMHMIPAEKRVERILLGIREGQIVTLDGYLVHVDGKDGWHWQSSLTRDDTGDGACEVVWVEQVGLSD